MIAISHLTSVLNICPFQIANEMGQYNSSPSIQKIGWTRTPKTVTCRKILKGQEGKRQNKINIYPDEMTKSFKCHLKFKLLSSKVKSIKNVFFYQEVQRMK